MKMEKNIQNKGEQEEIRQDKSEGESQEKSGYYIKRPVIRKKGPSKLRQQFSKGMTFFIVIVVCIIFYFALLRIDVISDACRVVFDVAKPVIYGLAIAYLLNPIVKTVDKHMVPFLEAHFPKMKKAKSLSRVTGIFIAVVFLLAVIIALFSMMIPELYGSIRNMVLTVPDQMNTAIDEISQIVSSNNKSAAGQVLTNILQEATDFLQNWMRTDLMDKVNVLMSNLTVGVISFVSELFNALVGLIVSVYVLYSKEKFFMQSKKIVYALLKPESANMLLHLTLKSNEMFGGFIIGKIIDSAIIGVLCFIGLSFLDMPYTLLVTVIVGVTNVIPFFGPYIGAIPSAVLIMLSDPKMGVYFLIFILALQQLDGNVIGPKILGDSTGLSAFWVIFSILMGGGLFGFVGMILGVPTFAVFYYIVSMLINSRLEAKNLPTETECYDERSYVDSDGSYVHSKENKEAEETAKN